MADIPLSSLFHRALMSAAKANNMATMNDETQELVQSALADLRLLQHRTAALSLFSENEVLADISTRDLVYLLVPFVLAEVEDHVRTTDLEERLVRVERVQRFLRSFLSSLETYQIVPDSEKDLYAKPAASYAEAQKRRESKIRQYKKEKEIKARIEEIRKRRSNGEVVSEPSSDFELIASLLFDPSATISETAAEEEDEDLDTEDIVREAVLLLLRLTYGKAQAQLSSLRGELELLRNAPPPAPPEPIDERHAKQRETEDMHMWRLDAPRPQGGSDGQGPLLDQSGKPLRPFTILSSSAAADRTQMRDQVFRPDHNLPTMSVDEYLEIERQRGNIISGGGPQSEQALTTKEQLQLDSEMDGTVFGEEKAEDKRQKDENWAQYTDTHPRGAGNTLNRG
ncbi:uncharacterized protein LAESUDRAFT_722561 [Laetiporus sulphureus 93-53]|uniref:TAP42-like protein n=1 Tax=Laetiporus sulphureus 93-53 TaxID=1314785 RepID=A0A165FZ00_9APHY|nr:uncharacterized protein LAESUDRAFT_722561 [Laetiporus sulphureus 93-53]KZT09598.1 hypothetical protein LAESUDRAFT_722561 [Laetiporus sulphureus 93-53]